MEELIEVGRAVGTQGNRGELRILPLLEQLEKYAQLDEVYLAQDSQEERPHKVLGIRVKGKLLIFRLAECDSIAAAQSLVGSTVKLPRRKLKKLPPDHYYWFEIEGLDVFGEDGHYWGQVVEIFPTGSNDVYVVKAGKKEFLLPALREVIREIDFDRKRMIIRPLEGLVEG